MRPYKVDKILLGSLIFLVAGYILAFVDIPQFYGSTWIHRYAHGIHNLIDQIWWGILLSILITGFIGRVPREMVVAILGTKKGVRGLLRATLAGLLLDVCSHGILVIGMRLYERGASIGQTMAFLIASPWNSLTLTFILVTLIGTPWTIAFILLSALIGITTGIIFDTLVANGKLPENPNQVPLRVDYNLIYEAQQEWKKTKFSPRFILDTIILGFKDSRSVMRWVLLGMVITGVMRASVSPEQFQVYFGPTFLGVAITLFFAIIIEVCSEGSTPLAADILNVAHAPGNAFTFLMAGVTTDYTEVMAIREATKSWKIALFLPLVTVPQTLAIAMIMNKFG